MEQKTTVSIFGACVSRDLFAMQRPETYEVQQYVSFVSPLSAVMTPPINGIQLNPDKIEPGRESAFSRRNLSKSFARVFLMKIGTIFYSYF